MSRALRYDPPLTGRGLILRPRLLARLRSRFERPLTAVVAAAGFGKTTLLGQAVSETVTKTITPKAKPKPSSGSGSGSRSGSGSGSGSEERERNSHRAGDDGGGNSDG